MFVKFLKDCKKFKKGEILKCSSLHGNALVKKGVAVPEPICYPIQDLYVAQLVEIKSRSGNNVTVAPVKYGIFYYKDNNSVFVSDGKERSTFIHAVTGVEFFPSNHKDCASLEVGTRIVFKPTVLPYQKFFMADMQLKGQTSKSYVCPSDLIYNDYKVRTRMSIKSATKENTK